MAEIRSEGGAPMRIPYFEAKDADSDIYCKGFYFEYPETTYCFTEDYEREPKCKLIPCLVTFRMTDWGLPNEPQLVRPINKSTLKLLGYIDTNNEFYNSKEYLLKESELKADNKNETQLDFEKFTIRNPSKEELQELKKLVINSPITIISTPDNKPNIELITEQAIRDKAIDDFAELLKGNLVRKYANANLTQQYVALQVTDWCNEIAEQLKAGEAE